MKRKIFSVLFALVLVLSFSLVTAVPAMANGATYYVATDGSNDYGDGSETWVDNDSSGNWTTGDTGPWQTIQHGINQASPGDTINVAAGTYHETGTFPDGFGGTHGGLKFAATQGGITLLGANAGIPGTGTRGPESIIVGPNMLHGNAVYIFGGADGVTVDGFTLGAYDDIVENRANNVVIRNNIIEPVPSPVDPLAPGIFAAGCNNMTIRNNLIRNTGGNGIFLGVTAGFTPVTNSLIEGNLIDAPMHAGILAYETDGITIRENTVRNAGGDGIRAGLYGKGLTIEGNDIYGSVGDGIDIRHDAASHSIHFNNIYNNGLYGVYNPTGTNVDATHNWWGNASGPVWAGMDYDIAYGDTVSDYVDYQPWLLAVVVPDVTPTTYDKTLALKDIWTLVSTDKEVTLGSDWVGTDVLADTATILAYKYTPGTGYTQVTLATQLTSVDAYYIKTDGGGGIGIKYSTAQPGVVTKTLGEGWNIVSSAIIDNAGAVLSPLRYVQIGVQQGVGLTTLASQGSYNQFSESFYVATFGDESWMPGSEYPALTSIWLSPYDGYWVYMNAAKIFGVVPD